MRIKSRSPLSARGFQVLPEKTRKRVSSFGGSVVVNYVSSKAGADAVVAAISAAGGKSVAVHGDVSKAAEAQGIIDAAIKSYGRLDILVNNSGVYVRADRSDYRRPVPQDFQH